MTLAEFIGARLDDDEQAATQGGIKGARWDFTGASCEVRVREPDGYLGEIVARCREGRAIDFSNTIHIARHDPARVLRQVAAMRAILAMYAESQSWSYPPGDGDEAVQETLQTVARHMAAIWSDHPDYQQEWKAS